MKKICIRVDGNEIIATGHVMRCLSVAQQLRKMGGQVVFVVADERPCPMIEEQGFDTYVMDSVWNDMDTETRTFCDYLVENSIKIVLLDSYYVTKDYLFSVSKVASVCYIDDMDKFTYPVHTIINYGLNYSRDYVVKYKRVDLDTEFLLGGVYAPLREEFSYKPYQVNKEVERVLITTGGTDQLGMSYSLLETFLGNKQTASLEYNVILGRFNKDKARLQELSKRYDNVKLHENVCNMSYWMRNCDVAVSAAGTTKYELSACGIPSICFEVADNQEGAIEWEENGYMLYGGNAYLEKDICLNICCDKLISLCNNYERRRELSHRMQQLVDGLGAKRISEYLLEI